MAKFKLKKADQDISVGIYFIDHLGLDKPTVKHDSYLALVSFEAYDPNATIREGCSAYIDKDNNKLTRNELLKRFQFVAEEVSKRHPDDIALKLDLSSIATILFNTIISVAFFIKQLTEYKLIEDHFEDNLIVTEIDRLLQSPNPDELLKQSSAIFRTYALFLIDYSIEMNKASFGSFLDAILIKIIFLFDDFLKVDPLLHPSQATHFYHEIDEALLLYSMLNRLDNSIRSKKKRIASLAAKVKHAKTDMAKKEIKEIWLSGRYDNRDLCAEQECAALGISFSCARRALRNI